jgi:nicotinamidase-related amidase
MTYEKFSAENAALLLIDHQVGTRSWVKSIPFEEMKRNALMLAKAAKILKLPVVLTSSMKEYAQGPLLGELESILPGTFAKRIKRVGIVDAMDDEKLAAAVRATGRKKLIIAGVTNDVCTSFRRSVWCAKVSRSRSSPMPAAHPARWPTTWRCAALSTAA